MAMLWLMAAVLFYIAFRINRLTEHGVIAGYLEPGKTYVLKTDKKLSIDETMAIIQFAQRVPCEIMILQPGMTLMGKKS